MTEVKLFRIHIDNQLKCDVHISNICKKASRQINTLKRISKYLTSGTKLKIYQSFVIANFSYCPAVYSQCLTKDAKKLEKLNERALRFVYNDFVSTYRELLKTKKHTSLHMMRTQAIIELVFRVLYNSAPPIESKILKIKQVPYNFRDNNILELPTYKTIKFGKNAFRYLGAKMWNSVPSAIKTFTNLHDFKQALLAWQGPECTCGSCFYCLYDNL